MIKTIDTLKGDWLTMKSVKVVFAAAVVVAVGFARADATTESRTAGAVVRFGVVTDLHCADLDTADHTKFVPVAGKVYYRESLGKLEKAVAALNASAVDFVIELGDFKDLTKNRASTLPILDRAEAAFAKFNGPRYHVLGNHDMDCLTKAEFFAHVKNCDAASGRHVNPTNGYYSLVKNGVTFIVLDACYTKDGADYTGNPTANWNWYEAKVPDAELAWLDATLKAAPGPAVVFCHQRLDPNAWCADNPKLTHAVINAADVRAVLEKSRKVRAVFTGHEHTGGVCKLNGITYHSLVAMVINGPADKTNSFAEVSVHPSGDVSVTEFRGGVAGVDKKVAR